MPRSSPIRLLAAGFALGAALLTAGAASGASSCQLATIGTLPVELKGWSPTTEGSVNGQPIMAVVDTGSMLTALTRKFAQRVSLDLRETEASAAGVESAQGVGGHSFVYSAHINELAFGPLVAKDVYVGVLSVLDEKLPGDGFLGADLLLARDLEMALQKGEIRVLIPDGCHDEFLAYWDREASVVPMSRLSRRDHRQVITLQINDTDVRAMIDSGASRSVIDTASAARLGVTRESSKILAEDSAGGVGPKRVDTWVASFRKVVIGRETIHDTELAVADLRSGFRQDADTTTRIKRRSDLGFDMLLGADFLKSHRVLFSVKQERFYFSYVGGHIFATDH
ncbi:MAG TPA: retroviral-like aspartic protease family protein [Burkholderiaceae bacterium]|jgi:predicted aspartyl protease|nr:retroviral-like aspartic protease family protein [Burkholderiaceae bacterium]